MKIEITHENKEEIKSGMQMKKKKKKVSPTCAKGHVNEAITDDGQFPVEERMLHELPM